MHNRPHVTPALELVWCLRALAVFAGICGVIVAIPLVETRTALAAAYAFSGVLITVTLFGLARIVSDLNAIARYYYPESDDDTPR